MVTLLCFLATLLRLPAARADAPAPRASGAGGPSTLGANAKANPGQLDTRASVNPSTGAAE
ncbi:MAG: hypothetical protein FWD17_19915, partial [Polyangiaceae bacterium]|nr:hypothetical protein [Polyangiaceae bacterium]